MQGNSRDLSRLGSYVVHCPETGPWLKTPDFQALWLDVGENSLNKHELSKSLRKRGLVSEWLLTCWCAICWWMLLRPDTFNITGPSYSNEEFIKGTEHDGNGSVAYVSYYSILAGMIRLGLSVSSGFTPLILASHLNTTSPTVHIRTPSISCISFLPTSQALSLCFKRNVIFK